eukprot:6214276-Pleurochrysis_carterae.AAC.4
MTVGPELLGSLYHNMKNSEEDATARDVSERTSSDGTKETTKRSKSRVPKVKLRELLRFAKPLDYLLLSIALVSALGCGACLPAVLVVFADSIQAAGQATAGAFDQSLLNKCANSTAMSEQ